MQKPGFILFDEEPRISCELRKKKNGYLLGGVSICFGLFSVVVLLLIVQVRVGCSRVETKPKVCGARRIRFPVMT